LLLSNCSCYSFTALFLFLLLFHYSLLLFATLCKFLLLFCCSSQFFTAYCYSFAAFYQSILLLTPFFYLYKGVPSPVVLKACKKEHESYTTCGTACPLSCEKPTLWGCSKQCVKGCFCDAGYVRDNKGNCILVEDCPKPSELNILLT